MTDFKSSHVHSNRYLFLRIPDEVNEDSCNPSSYLSGIYGQAGGRFHKILEFFEHYSVS